MRAFCALVVLAVTLICAPDARPQTLPDALRNAGVSVAQWSAVQAEVKRAAVKAGASERALAAVAQRVGINLLVDGRVDVAKVLAQIDASALQLAELQQRLNELSKANDPAVAQLIAEAQRAIEEGDLARGDKLLAQAASVDLESIALAGAELNALRSRAAKTIGERAALARLNGGEMTAASLYAQAAEIVPQSDFSARWRYRFGEAVALQVHSFARNDTALLRKNIEMLRSEVLPLARQAERASDGGTTWNAIGLGETRLAELGEDAAFQRAMAAHQQALEVRSISLSPIDWAKSQLNIGNVHAALGQRGDKRQFEMAVLAYDAALSVDSRVAEPSLWGRAHSNRGAVRASLAAIRGDEELFKSAEDDFQRALEVFSPARNPEDWADVRQRLGKLRSDKWSDPAAVSKSIAIFRSTLSELSRETYPATWHRIRSSLAEALFSSGMAGDASALREATEIHRSDLKFYTRDSQPMLWARAQFGLGQVSSLLASQGEAAAASEAATSFRAALEIYTRELDPMIWASTQSSLGGALHILARSGDDAALAGTIEAYSAALEIYTQSEMSGEWAVTQYNLALALQLAGAKDRLKLEAAVVAARAAQEWFRSRGMAGQEAMARDLVAQIDAVHSQ